MPTIEYMTTNYAYIKNDFNRCVYQVDGGTTENFTRQQTGWHFIPNNRWCDYLNPSQWFDLVTNHESVKIKSVSCAVMNLIPMTDQVAIQQTSTFLSFNNTLYALAYEDKNEETVCSLGLNAPKPKIYLREGVNISPTDGTVTEKQYLPTYTHYTPKIGIDTGSMKGYFWDPMIEASSLMELRPGKNSVTFYWEPSPADSHLKFSLNANKVTAHIINNDNTYNQTLRVNMGHTYKEGLITPHSKFIADTSIQKAAGAVTSQNEIPPVTAQIWATQNAYVHPIRNWFIKMIPIFDSKNALLQHEAQVCVVKKIVQLCGGR